MKPTTTSTEISYHFEFEIREHFIFENNIMTCSLGNRVSRSEVFGYFLQHISERGSHL